MEQSNKANARELQSKFLLGLPEPVLVSRQQRLVSDHVIDSILRLEKWKDTTQSLPVIVGSYDLEGRE